ncbi:DNA replication protein DnaC [Clostridia bacterium]|nr:DNA replication protein DnaC [Clostridia bacterium]
MGLDAKYYNQARAEINSRKADNAQKLWERENELSSRYKEYRELRYKLSGTGLEIVRVINSSVGKDGEAGKIRERIAAIAEDNLRTQDEIYAFLRKNSLPADYLDPIYSCKICRDTGVVPETGRRCICFKKILLRLSAEELNRASPLRLSGFGSFDTAIYPGKPQGARYSMKEVFDICQNFAEEFHLPNKSGGFLFLGKTGLGKTHLSLAIASEVLAREYSVIYGSAPDFFRKIEQERFSRRDYSRDSFETEDTLTRLQEADLLILDDLGAEFESRFYTDVLYILLNTRINAMRPTIISTNFEPEVLFKRYGERIISRMFTLRKLDFYGKDFRQRSIAGE